MQNEKSWKTENKGVGIMQPIPSAFFPSLFFSPFLPKKDRGKSKQEKTLNDLVAFSFEEVL